MNISFSQYDSNDAFAECLKKESDVFKSLERLEKSNQLEDILDVVFKSVDFGNSFYHLPQFQKNQIIGCTCIACAVSACFICLA